jgi:hypothetical protein
MLAIPGQEQAGPQAAAHALLKFVQQWSKNKNNAG